jgi:2-oxoglutarate ferredoxin oxidoreductase subunit delta
MKGKIAIDRDLCKGCGYCIEACPRKLIIYDKGFNYMSYHPVTTVNGGGCNGCGLCSIVCPDMAISVWRSNNKVKNKL